MGDHVDTQPNKAKRQSDFDDLQHELAGLDAGRIKRFLSLDDDRSPEGKRKKRARERARLLLADLMLDPVYKAKYDQAWDLLRGAERAVASAHDRIHAELLAAQEVLQKLKDQAARVPGGELVFRDQNGVVRYANGEAVEEDLAASILWTGHEPSYEAIQNASDRIAALEAQQRELQRFETDVLGRARDRLSDDSDPPSFDELGEITLKMKSQLPNTIQTQASSDTQLSSKEKTAAIELPVIGGKP